MLCCDTCYYYLCYDTYICEYTVERERTIIWDQSYFVLGFGRAQTNSCIIHHCTFVACFSLASASLGLAYHLIPQNTIMSLHYSTVALPIIPLLTACSLLTFLLRLPVKVRG
jgi:hypothetical protein